MEQQKNKAQQQLKKKQLKAKQVGSNVKNSISYSSYLEHARRNAIDVLQEACHALGDGVKNTYNLDYGKSRYKDYYNVFKNLSADQGKITQKDIDPSRKPLLDPVWGRVHQSADYEAYLQNAVARAKTDLKTSARELPDNMKTKYKVPETKKAPEMTQTQYEDSYKSLKSLIGGWRGRAQSTARRNAASKPQAQAKTPKTR